MAAICIFAATAINFDIQALLASFFLCSNPPDWPAFYAGFFFARQPASGFQLLLDRGFMRAENLPDFTNAGTLCHSGNQFCNFMPLPAPL